MGHRTRSAKTVKAVARAAESDSNRNTPLVSIVISVLLATMVWIVFGQTLGHDFVNFDDNDYVYGDRLITAGLTSDGIRWALTGTHANNWHPITTLSHMIDCQLYGIAPRGHHLTNVFLHMVAVILLFLALRSLTNAVWLSAIVAALFAIHPLRVSSVAWVAERKDVLSGVFFMLVLWTYARFARSEHASRGRYLVVVLLFALGLMCKPTLVTLPLVLLLLDYWPLRRVASQGGGYPWNYLILEKIPLLLLSAASCVVTIFAQRNAMLPAGALTFWERFGNAATAYVIYLVQTIYPTNLAVFYPYPQNHVDSGEAALATLVLVMITAALFVWRKRYPSLLIGWFWFLGMLVPMIGLIQVGAQPHADRYTYLPQIGLFLGVVWVVAAFIKKWQQRREVTAALAGAVVITLVIISYRETSYWLNSETLWQRTLAHTEKNHIAENNLGDTLALQNRFEEAKGHYQNALQIFPLYAKATNNLGYTLWKLGDKSHAIDLYLKALQISPELASAHTNLGVSLADGGNPTEAIKHFREALRISPGLVEARYNLASALVQIGQGDEAVVQLREAQRLDPNNEEVKSRLRALGLPE